MAKSDAKVDDLNKASEDLGQILQTVGAAIYQQSNPPTGGQPEAGAPGQPNPEETKTDDKSDDKKEAEEGEVVQ